MSEKNFIVFAGSTYYPLPGWENFLGRYGTLKEACNAGRNEDRDWWQVVDLSINKIVEGGGGKAYTVGEYDIWKGEKSA